MLGVVCLAGAANASGFTETPDIVVEPDFCSLYPITVPNELLQGASPGQTFRRVRLGTRPGNYSWLSWTGRTDANTLEASLIPPGDSHTYANPDDASDGRLDVADWVQGAPGVKNSRGVRDRADALLGRNIIVPVWGEVRGQGARFDYKTARFAVISLSDYRFNGKGYISFSFVRFTKCYNSKPSALGQTVTTEEDEPITFDLQAEDPDGDELHYEVLDDPEHGTIEAANQTITYQPAPGYHGDDSLTFRVHDGEQLSNVATVSIVVEKVNEPPVITSEPVVTTPEQSDYQYPVLVEDPNDDPIAYSLDRSPVGMEIGNDTGVVEWLPQDEYVQTVPTFNDECYVVPTGAVKVYEEGDQDSGVAYMPPIFRRVQQAIESGGQYTAEEAVEWHERKQCLGCHVQTQSLLGLASSRDKADVDEQASAYLLDVMLDSQQNDGTIRLSHPNASKMQTALALWSLNATDAERTFATRTDALAYMWGVRRQSGEQTYWTRDHTDGYWRWDDVINAMVAQSVAHLLADGEDIAPTPDQQAVIDNYRAELPRLAEYYLARYQDHSDENLVNAFRLMGLAELRPHITDSALLSRVEAAIDELDALLRSRQVADGGWNRTGGSGTGDPLTSAWVGMALDYENPPLTDPVVTANIEFLLDAQSPSGTWVTNSGLFNTHLATTSLVMAYLPVALEFLGNPDVRTGDILLSEGDAGVHALTATITNRGLADIIAPLTVNFYNGEPANGDLLGSAELTGLASGATRRPTIEVEDARLTDDVYVSLDVSDVADECQITNNQSRAALVRVRAADPDDAFDTQVFTLNVNDVNEPPEIVSAPPTELQGGQSYDYQVQIADPDVGDAHTYAVETGPAGLFIDPHTGAFSSEPAGVVPGAHEVAVSVTDLRGATDRQTFTLTVHENQPPEITTSAVIRGDESDGYQYDADASDSNPGDELEWGIEHGPDDLEVDRESGALVWTNPGDFVDNRVDTNRYCRGNPVSGTLDPVLQWQWQGGPGIEDYVNVYGPVVVGQLTDDNADGQIDLRDTPDLVFAASDSAAKNALVAVSGDDGRTIWKNTNADISPYASAALGDIDRDGIVEIVIVGSQRHTLTAFEHDGTPKWTAPAGPSRSGFPTDGISIADLNSDEVPEIVLGNRVYTSTGDLLWKGDKDYGGSAAYGVVPVVADIDRDGKSEVVAGRTVYGSNGEVLWHANEIPFDGYNAVGDFDADDDPEIVLVASGSVYLLEHNGDLKWGPVRLPGGGNGGPPTIGDFDGDGQAEIGVAGADNYVVLEGSGKVKWTSFTQDSSSHRTGATAFDFEGDGRLEILYADELAFYVFDGRTGETRLEMANGSGTVLEYPLVVDLDKDGQAEVVVTSGGDGGGRGVRVFESESGSWAPTRSIWNQHAYSINNVNDDGTIPANPEPSWLSHNTYRLNAFPDRPALAQPDLTVHGITYDETTQALTVTVLNRGLAPVTRPVEVRFIHEHFWNGDAELGTTTVDGLAAGESRAVSLTVDDETLVQAVRAELNVSNGIDECATDNNSTRAAIVDLRVYDPAGLYDRQKYAFSISDVNESPEITSARISGATVGEPYSFQVTVEDPDRGDGVVYRLENAPDTLQIGRYSGRITGTLDAEGGHLFRIVATDLSGAEDVETHALSVAAPDNYAPEITSTPVTSVLAGDAYYYAVTATDEDGDALTYTLSNAPDGMTIDSGTGEVEWSPVFDQVGQHPVEVTVVDARNASTHQTFSVEVTDPNAGNAPPTITSVPSGVAVAGNVFTYQVEATDPDGDDLSYRLERAIPAMTLDDAGLFEWLPEASQEGETFVVDIIVEDGRGGSATQTLTLPVNAGANSPPTITSTPALSVNAGENYEYRLQASDPDGDTVSFRLDTAPIGMTMAAGGLVQWTPTSPQVGRAHEVVVFAEDARGAVSTQSFSIAVNEAGEPNEPPRILSAPRSPALVGETYEYQVTAVDEDGDELSYTLPDAPSEMVIDDAGLVSWTPSAPGEHAVAVNVSDGRAHATQSFTLAAVESDGSNSYPDITSTPATEALAEYQYTYQVIATDADGDALTFGLAAAPTGMSIDDNGLVSWTPAAEQVGSHTVEVYAGDGTGRAVQTYQLRVEEASAELGVHIALDPPTLEPGESATLTVTTSGAAGGASVEATLDGDPLPLDDLGQAVIDAPAIGGHTVEVTATDDRGSVTETFDFSVGDPDDTEAPVATIHAPARNTEITAPADVVASVSDATLTSYELAYRPKGGEDWTLLATGSDNVDEQAVASFDPTLLHNGIYEVRLVATDAGGKRTTDHTQVVVDGELKVGHFSLTFEDLSVDLAGIPVRVTRTYDTRQRSQSLDFGHGWSVGYQNVHLQESRTIGFAWSLNEYDTGVFSDWCVEPDGDPVVTVRLPSGEVEKFRPRAEPHCTSITPTIDVRLVFEPIDGTDSTLEQTAYGMLRLVNGHIMKLGEAEPVDPDAYRLTTSDGMVYELDQGFGIRRIIEPGGEYIEYSGSGIEHSQGYAIDFERDAHNRITAVVTPDGRRVEYTYTVFGDLETVTDLSGNTTEFSYLWRQPHYLDEVTDPRGVSATRMEYDEDGRLLAVIDADGNRIEYEHDLAGRTEVVRDRRGNPTTYVYDDQGRVLAETNPLGETITRTYNEEGDVLTETNDPGETTTWTYDERGNRLTETNPMQQTTTFTYTDNGRLLTEMDHLGNPVVTNTYDSGTHKLASTTDGAGNTTRFHWDGTGSCSAGASRGFTNAENKRHTIQPVCSGPFAHLPSYEIDVNGVRTDYRYDSAGRKVSETVTRTDADGNTVTLVTRYEYDAEGRVTRVIHPDQTETITEYNRIGKVAAEIDAEGRRTEYEYDARGNRVLTRYPDQTTETRAYDKAGNVVSRTDRANRATTMVYDAANRLVETHYPDGTATYNEYDGAGRLKATIDERGHRTEYAYDRAGRRTLVRDHLGNETRYEYDVRGRRIATIDPRGKRTEYEYDNAGRLVETRYHDGTHTRATYDGLGRKVSETDERGRTTHFGYDPRGNLIEVTDAAGETTTYTYDEQGNKLTQTDAEERTTTWAYDPMGRVISRTLPLGQTETFAYDRAGNRTRHTDFNGETTTYTYDRMNREVARHYEDDPAVTTTYTATGKVNTVTDGRGATDHTYDRRDRLTRIDYPDGGYVEYAYDQAGNRTAVRTAHGETRYDYDAVNRLASVTDANGKTTYGYDRAGNRTRVTHPNGVETTYAYDDRNRLTRIETVNAAGDVLQGLTYTFNDNGTRAQLAEDSGRTVRYSYDRLDRLVEEAVTDPTYGDRTTSWTYDKVGNRLTEATTTASGTETVTYEYDRNDRLLEEIGPAGTTTYAYDANGNLTRRTAPDGTTAYTWTDGNRLARADEGNRTVQYTYDTDGIRQSRTVDGVTTDFLVDPNRAYAEVIAEEDTSGNPLARYTHARDLVAQRRNGTAAYNHADGLGSTRLLTDASGTVTDRYVYEAFGEMEAESGSNENDYRFAGEVLDDELGLYYLRARHYNPSIGRFTGMDQWPGLRADPSTLHRYSYVHNDPANNVDPSGYMTLGSTASSLNAMGTLSGIALPSIGQYALRTTFKRLMLAVGTAAVAHIGGYLATKERGKKEARSELKNKVLRETSRRRGTVLYHYSDRGAVMEILGTSTMYCSNPYKGRLGGGRTYPAGAYATDIYPWSDDYTQRDLKSIFYGGNKGRDVSWFVAIDGEEFYQYMGSQWVRQCPAGSAIEVEPYLIGPNLMEP